MKIVSGERRPSRPAGSAAFDFVHGKNRGPQHRRTALPAAERQKTESKRQKAESGTCRPKVRRYEKHSKKQSRSFAALRMTFPGCRCDVRMHRKRSDGCETRGICRAETRVTENAPQTLSGERLRQPACNGCHGATQSRIPRWETGCEGEKSMMRGEWRFTS